VSEKKQTEEISERKKEFKTTVGGTIVNRVYTSGDIDVRQPGDIAFLGNIPIPGI